MASEKIKEYIEKTKKAGYNDEQIKSALKKAGWNDAEIAETMGKQDNLDLLAQLSHFVNTGYSVLLGASRKRFMGVICDVSEPSELVTATAVTTALGVMAGVQLFRVHDVKENRQAADVASAVLSARI